MSLVFKNFFVVYSVTKVKRKTWEDKNMRDALKAVVEDGKSVSGAAKRFNVPRRTLDDRVKGRVRHGSRPGPKTALSKEEEDALCSYLIYMAERGSSTPRKRKETKGKGEAEERGAKASKKNTSGRF